MNLENSTVIPADGKYKVYAAWLDSRNRNELPRLQVTECPTIGWLCGQLHSDKFVTEMIAYDANTRTGALVCDLNNIYSDQCYFVMFAESDLECEKAEWYGEVYEILKKRVEKRKEAHKRMVTRQRQGVNELDNTQG